MSEEETKPQAEPNFRDLFEASTDDRTSLIRDLITSGKELRTKTRVPNVMAMTALDQLGKWEYYRASGNVKQALEDYGHNFRENEISKDGQSRLEYLTATAAYLAQKMPQLGEEAKRLQEGQGGKK